MRFGRPSPLDQPVELRAVLTALSEGGRVFLLHGITPAINAAVLEENHSTGMVVAKA